MDDEFDVAIVGGGIIGLATALALTGLRPDLHVAVLEKEGRWGAHQSSHNSGVIHAGVYYRPGSAKAVLCAAGNRSMVAFCDVHDVRHVVCGKLIVAVEPGEVTALDELQRRTLANGVPARRLTPREALKHEPNVRCVAALHLPTTGVVDFADVCAAMVRLLLERGVVIRAGAALTAVEDRARSKVLRTSTGALSCSFLVNCAGLHSDRVARLDGVQPAARILPFRGEYYELLPARRSLVRALVYPVPDPAFPFLGAHFTKGVDGSVHAGPNAVPALKREGYRWRDVSLEDIGDLVFYRGTWRLARRYAAEARREILRSLSRTAFTRSLQRLVPDVAAADLVRAPAGVRAQAVGNDGTLVDDFLFVRGHRSLHVCNAPSPAATASLEIGKYIAGEIFDGAGAIGE